MQECCKPCHNDRSNFFLRRHECAGTAVRHVFPALDQSQNPWLLEPVSFEPAPEIFQNSTKVSQAEGTLDRRHTANQRRVYKNRIITTAEEQVGLLFIELFHTAAGFKLLAPVFSKYFEHCSRREIPTSATASGEHGRHTRSRRRHFHRATRRENSGRQTGSNA